MDIAPRDAVERVLARMASAVSIRSLCQLCRGQRPHMGSSPWSISPNTACSRTSSRSVNSRWILTRVPISAMVSTICRCRSIGGRSTGKSWNSAATQRGHRTRERLAQYGFLHGLIGEVSGQIGRHDELGLGLIRRQAEL